MMPSLGRGRNDRAGSREIDRRFFHPRPAQASFVGITRPAEKEKERASGVVPEPASPITLITAVKNCRCGNPLAQRHRDCVVGPVGRVESRALLRRLFKLLFAGFHRMTMIRHEFPRSCYAGAIAGICPR